MSNLGERGNMLPALQQPTPENTPPPVEAFKTPDKIFSNKKIKKKEEPVNEVENVQEVDQEPVEQAQPAEETPIYVPMRKRPKKPRKKAVYTPEAKARMEAGRRKGLETRRKRLAEKRARELMELQQRGVGVQKAPVNKVEKTMNKAKEVIQKGVQNVQVEKEYEYEPEDEDPEASFEQFVNFMDRYDALRQKRKTSNKVNYNNTARSRVRPPLPKVRPPTPAQQRWNPRANPRPGSNQAYISNNGYNPVRQRRPRMNKETNNPFLQYFS
tara:strand:+ start:1341 stop:2150 length:810 start_codon:yes stop_codon:yes gene_type:complete